MTVIINIHTEISILMTLRTILKHSTNDNASYQQESRLRLGITLSSLYFASENCNCNIMKLVGFLSVLAIALLRSVDAHEV